MRFFVAITDYSWFTYLAEKQPDEINFWKPSASVDFQIGCALAAESCVVGEAESGSCGISICEFLRDSK